MKTRKLLALCLAPLFTVAMIGCDVDVTEDGSLPTVDVEGGSMPEVDVEGPTVTTGTTEVEVPTVGIDIPEEGDNE